MTRIGTLTAAIVALGGGCSDDSAGTDAALPLADAAQREGGSQEVGIAPFAATVITAVGLLHDIDVVLTRPAPRELQVDIESSDRTTVGVVTGTLAFRKWDQKKTTTLEGLKESTADVAVIFSVRGSAASQTLKVRVLRTPPDAGPPADA